MTAMQFLERAAAAGITFTLVDQGTVRADGPAEAMTAFDALIDQHSGDLVAIIEELTDTRPAVLAAEAILHDACRHAATAKRTRTGTSCGQQT